MPGANAFQVEGVVLEALPNGTFRVELRNGHRLLAFVPGRARAGGAGIAAGQTVRLELSPYDLSAGRIRLKEKTI